LCLAPWPPSLVPEPLVTKLSVVPEPLAFPVFSGGILHFFFFFCGKSTDPEEEEEENIFIYLIFIIQ
jgi:hypothetical protein